MTISQPNSGQAPISHTPRPSPPVRHRQLGAAPNYHPPLASGGMAACRLAPARTMRGSRATAELEHCGVARAHCGRPRGRSAPSAVSRATRMPGPGHPLSV